MSTRDHSHEGLHVSRQEFLKWSLATGIVVLAGSTVSGLAPVNEAEAQMPGGEVAPQYPFPQHAVYTEGTIKPNYVTQGELDEKTQEFYDRWKAKYLVNGCGPGRYYVIVNADGGGGGGRKPESISISEGHGYGMMITALMAGYDPQAKTEFDGLYQFFKDHPSKHHPYLMAWLQVEGCNSADTETATDGDLDIAYALLLADKQWGSDGDIDYLQEAKNVINAIMEKEINPDTSLPYLADGEEDWLQKNRYKYGTRPSDFIVDHMRAYQVATGDAQWTAVIDATYELIDFMQTRHSPSTGLLPDFIQNTNTTPRPAKGKKGKPYLEGRTDGQYYYNACRVPWRIGTDYLTSGDSRALDALDKINAWVRSKTGGDPGNIVAGYKLNGRATGTENAVAFFAPFGVGAMVSADNQEWLNDIWDLTVDRARIMEDYYGNTLKLLAMITMSGNWWTPTA